MGHEPDDGRDFRSSPPRSDPPPVSGRSAGMGSAWLDTDAGRDGCRSALSWSPPPGSAGGGLLSKTAMLVSTVSSCSPPLRSEIGDRATSAAASTSGAGARSVAPPSSPAAPPAVPRPAPKGHMSGECSLPRLRVVRGVLWPYGIATGAQPIQVHVFSHTKLIAIQMKFFF